MTPSDVAALLARGRRDEALSAAAEGVRTNPGDARWRYTLGAVLVELRQFVAAERVLRDALAAAGDAPEILFNLAVALRGQSRFADALDTLARIPTSWPKAKRVAAELAQAGLYCLVSGRHDVAERAFRDQLRFQPGSRSASHNLVLALLALRRYDDAAAAASEALAAGHRDAELLAMLVNARGLACDWAGLDAIVEELRRAAREPGSRPAHPQGALYLAEVGAAEQRQWAESYCRIVFAGLEPIPRAAAAPAPGKLRIAYLSSDFRDHATSWLLVGLIENHDRERFEVRAYSTGPKVGTPVRERIARAMDGFVDCSGVPGRTVAERISADGADIVIDLGGHVEGARLDILAYRPAPLQGHFLGYPGTTGASFVDFFIADATTVPAGMEANFSERVLRMPRCIWPGDPKRAVPVPDTRAKHGLPGDAVVLCSFNQAVKIRASVFREWCRLLQEIPNAVLWLLDPGESPRRRLAEFADRHGVADRLVFAPHLAHDEHTNRLAAADIALDTYPYGSHTNAGDALWAGVPFITTYGETFASRAGASHLATAGLSEWAFDDAGSAFDAVVALARDPAKLAAAKEKARAARGSALFDAAGFARDFERVLLQAAGRHAP